MRRVKVLQPKFSRTRKEIRQEALQLSRLLKGKVVARIMRPSKDEICVEFTNGARLFFGPWNKKYRAMDVSVT